MTWREQAAPIIKKVLEENAGKSEREIRLALREAYPFGPREYHPYRMWCSEVRRQLGLEQVPERQAPARKVVPPDPRQDSLF